MIPRKLHQVYLSGDLPYVLRDNVNHLKSQNPLWSYNLYDNNCAMDFIVKEYGNSIAKYYQRIDPAYGAARADFLRHLLIYKEGGVYLDIKSTFSKPLDNVILCDDKYIVSQWSNAPGSLEEGFGLHRDLAHVPGGEYQIFHVIAEAGHAFSAAAIDMIMRNIRKYKPWSSVGRIGVLRTTGPIAYTLAIHPILDQHPHRLVKADDIGARWTIGGDYNHADTFRNHYSTLTGPIIKQGTLGRYCARAFAGLRRLKAAS